MDEPAGPLTSPAGPARPEPAPDSVPVGPAEAGQPSKPGHRGNSGEPGKSGKPGKAGKRGKRPHPYADEKSTPAEHATHPALVTLFWVGLATVLAAVGLYLGGKYGTYAGSEPLDNWGQLTLIPLFGGLGLLGFGFIEQRWTQRITMVGWVLFASYWGLEALDLYVSENQDYVNFVFAVVGVYFFVYLAYHQWLSVARGVHNETLRFLNVATFVAAGSYFVIDKIQAVRLWLINVVGLHTKWGLDVFGQGDSAGLQFVIDAADTRGPVTFFYPAKYCDPYRPDLIGEYCKTNNIPPTYTIPETGGSWLQQLLHFAPDGETMIVPVSIILACTAAQSIMLFVGLVMGTRAPWQAKLKASLIVAAVVYILNLLRNVGIIWFYGQGHASFWVMHNAVGKGGSLIAMVAIAFAIFRWFPPFFHSLVGVLDLPERDGPVERTLRLGRRRPEPAASVEVGAAGA